MCNLSWTPHSNLEKDNSLTTPVLAQRWAVWSILTKNSLVDIIVTLKVKFRTYPSIHTNYIISHSTILQYNHNNILIR